MNYPLTFSGISLNLAPQGNQLWLSNDQLANCLGIGQSRIRDLPSRHPELFSESDTRLMQVDLVSLPATSNTQAQADVMSLLETSHTQTRADVVSLPATPHIRKSRARNRQNTRFWSFPEGVMSAVLQVNTGRAKQFTKWLLNHYKMKALQAGNYIYAKRPRMRLVAEAANAGGNTRAQAEAAGFRCLSSARRNRKEAYHAGLLNTPALPESAQLALFAPAPAHISAA